jgi:hypothetical protein
MGNSHKNLLLRNHWANCNQTFVEWSLDGILPNLCPVIPTSNQDGRQGCGGHLDRRAEPPDTFLEENHTMTISSKFCSYWANGFRQKDFYGNFPYMYYRIFYELWTFTDFDRLCKLEKRGDEIKKNLLLWNYWANLNQTLLKWFLGGPLPNLCPTFQNSD